MQAVLRYVRQFGENGVMHSKVMRGVHFGAKRIGEAIQTLKERDQIDSWSGKGGATFYRAKKGGQTMREDVFNQDGDVACARAREKRQAEYLKALKDCRVAVTPGGVDVGFVSGFFADRVGEFDAGTVAKYDFPIWKTIGCVLSFTMEFYYAFLDCDGSRSPDVRKDICGMTDVLDASSDQMEISKGLESYLVAAAALARRIGSSTYEGWRTLLVQVEFEQAHGVVVFEKKGMFDVFFKKLTNLLQLLWADNEIARHNSDSQQTPTPPQKELKKRKV